MVRVISIFAVLTLLIAASANAALVLSHSDTASYDGATVDGTISSGEYGPGNSYSYTGGGGGFGGPLGNGTIYMESDYLAFPGNLYVGAHIAGDLGSNIIAVFMDTRAGGFSNDSTLGDFADGGRKVASKVTIDVQDNFPIPADFVLEFGNGFTNLFELKTGSLNYIAPVSAGTGGQGGPGDREVRIPLSTLGMIAGQKVDFFTVLVSDSGYSSNEGIPNPNLPGTNGGPGFNNYGTFQPVNCPDFDRFVTAPEPTTFVVWSLLLVSMGLVASRLKSK